MIDYVSGFFPCKHDPSKLISGMVMSFDSLGNQEWVCNKNSLLRVLIHLKSNFNHILKI